MPICCSGAAARARGLIASGMPLAEAAAHSGFADQSHMTRLFVRSFGMAPGFYARAARPALRDALQFPSRPRKPAWRGWGSHPLSSTRPDLAVLLRTLHPPRLS
jgi:AraC-like DNA-binding protein